MASLKLEGLCSQNEAWLFYWGWSRIYDRMQPYFTSPEMREAGLDLAEVSGPLDVLDVGAGTGTLSLQVVERCGGAERLTLLDQSAQMLDQAKGKPALGRCKKFIISDAQTLPFDDDSFDRVVSSGVFYYFPQPVEALREQMRVVRPGGRVLVMGSLQPKPLVVRFLAQTFNRFPTEEQYRTWFKEAGLADVQVRFVANPWNDKQYAIAICGTKAVGTPQPARNRPAADTSLHRLRRLSYWPVALGRFALAMGAFALVGPLQIATAAMGMRRLRQREAPSKS
mmetsp:Transcript_63350/g.125242  ORF Transcript_63350/g.125242 Transcript_63350/m.125242 type:complete len:282 (-) Transcript_63350:270-1115(-)|eukprot:CAMPEP_0174696806 /NCGR_PEP_ID=MMETSP1094-20130205/2863_1 /TAXON_ID=156173 /ORGANISM="Chrysochromulina brevifilum, Strain UTEX LB 985" /LENGTH=281 /DNA_ID=CAMNT_0015893669 /DNA_START=99 /DNA_END=944 /DNA_ORIENTATION=+